MPVPRPARRTAVFLRLAAAAGALAGCLAGPPAPISSPTSVPATSADEGLQAAAPPVFTPTACAAVLTPAQTEGPYYRSGSPERSALVESEVDGTPLLVTGTVMTADCRPLAGIRIEFWQADGSGAYDNFGFRFRGHQFSDARGGYRLETVLPGEYPGRTPHIHVKLFSAEGDELLTTQLYLRGVSDQVPDRIFDPGLLADDRPAEPGGRRHVSFDFVLTP